MTAEAPIRIYGYRWVVLGAFCLVNLTMQTLWIAYAPITGPAAKFYGVSDMAIGMLAMSFMIAFIPLSIPASWVIDTFGFRFAVNVGAALMGVFGLVRGLAGSSYALVLTGTIGVAVAQPFFLNAWTKLPAQWFAVRERATAVGIITLANLIGTGVGMALTPVLTQSMPIPKVQLLYGAAGLGRLRLRDGGDEEGGWIVYAVPPLRHWDDGRRGGVGDPAEGRDPEDRLRACRDA